MQFSKIIVGIAGMLIGVCSLQLVVHTQAQIRADGGEVAAPELQRRVEEVWREHGLDLLDNNIDVLGAAPSPYTGEIIITTDRPAMVPKFIDGIPVKVVAIEVAEPPLGVVLLLPDGKYEIRNDLDECPERYKEYEQLRWRWCQPRKGPMQSFPLYLTDKIPGVGGMPLDAAKGIFNRHKDALMALPGVNAVGLNKAGLRVETDQPELIPSDIEGLPVTTGPRKNRQHDIDHDWYTKAAKARLNSR